MNGQTYSFRFGNGVKKSYDVKKLVEWAKKNYPKQLVQIDRLEEAAATTKTDEPWGSPEFHRRAMESELKYPLLVVQHPDDDLHVADGMHRLYKHLIIGDVRIPAYVIPSEKLPESALLYQVP